MNRIFLFISVFIFITIGRSQAQLNIDSIQKIIQTAKNDTVKIKAYMDWDGLIYLQDYKLDIELNDKVKIICEKNLKRKKISEKERKFYQFHLGKTYNNKGLALSTQGLYPEAHQLFFEGLEVARKAKDTSTISNLYNNIGVVFWNKKSYANAEKYFLMGIAMEDAIGDEQGKSDVYNNLGLVYRDMNDKVRALDCFKKSLALNDAGSNEAGRANNYHNIALIYSDIGELDTAMKYYEAAILIFKKIEYSQGIANSITAMGEVFNKMGRYDRAIANCTEALLIGRSNKITPAIRDACNCLYLANRGLGNTKTALEFFEEFIRVDDSLSNKKWSSEIDKIELRHEFKQKEQEIKLAEEKKNILARAENHRQQIIIYSVSAGLVIVLILALIILKNLRLNKQKSAIISEQKALVEEKQKEIVDSINYAKRIQYTLLAHDSLLKQNLPDHFVFFQPKDIVSGDFYWATKAETGHNEFYFAVCDSTGHGVPGAFMSLLNISFLNEAITEKHMNDPAPIFNHVRERLIENISQQGAMDGMDGILLKLVKTNNGYLISYVGANRAPVIIRNKACTELSCDKMHVGYSEKFSSFTTHQIEVQKGDVLYLFTDGFYDQFGGPQGKKFKKSNLKLLLAEIHQLPMAEQKTILQERLGSWMDNLEQIDDVCVAGIRF